MKITTQDRFINNLADPVNKKNIWLGLSKKKQRKDATDAKKNANLRILFLPNLSLSIIKIPIKSPKRQRKHYSKIPIKS